MATLETGSNIEITTPSDDSIIKARRKSIYGESYDPTEDSDPNFCIQFPKSPEDREMISNALKCVWLTKDMDFDQKEAIIDGMVLKTYKPGDLVYEIGQVADKFYIVSTGIFECFEWRAGKTGHDQNLEKTKILKKGDYFGEIALLYDAPRVMKVISSLDSATPNATYEIQRHLFRKLSVQRAYQKRKKLQELIDKCTIFEHLSDREKDKVVNAMKVTSYEDGEIIVSLEEALTGMYFVLKGKLKVQFNDVKNGARKEFVANPGQWLGEISLLMSNNECRRGCILKAIGAVTTGYLNAADFEKMLGKNSIQRNSKRYEELVNRAIHFSNVSSASNDQ